MVGRRGARMRRLSFHDCRDRPGLDPGSHPVHRDHDPGPRCPPRGLLHRRDHQGLDPGSHPGHALGLLYRRDRQGLDPGSRLDHDSGPRRPPAVPADVEASFRGWVGAHRARSVLLAWPCRCCRRTGYCLAGGPGYGPCRKCHRTDCYQAGARSAAGCQATDAARLRSRRALRLLPRATLRPQMGPQMEPRRSALRQVTVPQAPALRVPKALPALEMTGTEKWRSASGTTELDLNQSRSPATQGLAGWGRSSPHPPRRLLSVPSPSS